jgi:hypothetical protein
VGFIADRRLKKVSVNDGVVIDLARASGNPGAWGPDDAIIFATTDGLATISAAGSVRTLLSPAQVDAGGTAWYPDILPVKDKALVSSRQGFTDLGGDASIDLLTVSTGERRVLVQGGTLPRYLKSGHLVFIRRGSLMAVPFDLKTLKTVGSPVEVLKGLRTNYGDVGAFSCSDTGTCIYAPGSSNMQRTVVMVDRAGTPRTLPLAPLNYSQPRLSPAADRLLFWLEQLRCDVAVADLVHGGVTHLTSDGDNHYPAWLPGAQQISYLSNKRDAPKYAVFLRSVNGSSADEPLVADIPGLGPEAPLSWARDRTLAYSDGENIWTITPGSRRPQAFANSRFVETSPAFSPDGRSIAYADDEAGRFQIYVKPFPGPGDPVPISTDGGDEPVWSRSGTELFYRSGDQMMAVAVLQTSPFRAARPKVLFTARYLHAQSIHRTEYDVGPNGEFVMVSAPEGDQPATQINVLMNWFEELTARVPTK